MSELDIEILSELIEEYLQSIPDDDGEGWSYERGEIISYRESARQFFDFFLSWLKRGERQ